jgi:hypothetical protein
MATAATPNTTSNVRCESGSPVHPGGAPVGGPLTGIEIARRHREGAEIIVRTSDHGVPEGAAPLFVVHPGGRLDPVTAGKTPRPQDGDMLVLLGPVPQRPA